MGSDTSAGAGFAIRTFQSAQDAGAVAEILRQAREAASWSEEALRETVLLPGISAYVSERNSVITGIVVGRQVLDEAEILNLAVAWGMRRRGEGGALVRQLLNRFEEGGVSRVFLEVRESNAGGIAFYRELGFQAVGIRKDYYQDPKEPARVMELWLKNSAD
jgi:ribosomal-protein-alanine N-acetyltransferase